MDKRKVERAINLIQSGAAMAEKAGQPIEVAYSGGKDSDVILELTKMAGVKYRAIYKNTTIDPPGTISHVKEMGAEILRPKMSYYEILCKYGYPNRFLRFCCRLLKEYKVMDYNIVGIRSDESKKRAKNYKEPEYCRHYPNGSKAKQYLPILDWTLKDVEDFIQERNINLAPVYYREDRTIDFSRRLGCLCCPQMTRKNRIEQFRQYPNMVKLYIRGGKCL